MGAVYSQMIARVPALMSLRDSEDTILQTVLSRLISAAVKVNIGYSKCLCVAGGSSQGSLDDRYDF